MKNSTLALLIALLGAFFSSLSQYLLKRAAEKPGANRLQGLLQPQVLLAYAIFFLVLVANLFTLKHLPLYVLPLIEATSYVYVALLSFFVLKEKLSKRKLLGLLCIVAGVVIASL